MKPENIGPYFQARKISKEMSQGSRDRQVKEGRSKGSKGEGKIKKKNDRATIIHKRFQACKVQTYVKQVFGFRHKVTYHCFCGW